MVVIIGLLALAIVVSTALTLRAVAELRAVVIERSNSLADLEAGLHKIGRQYIGHELIEKRVLPTIGYREPEKSPIERWMLATWKAETADTPETN